MLADVCQGSGALGRFWSSRWTRRAYPPRAVGKWGEDAKEWLAESYGADQDSRAYRYTETTTNVGSVFIGGAGVVQGAVRGAPRAWNAAKGLFTGGAWTAARSAAGRAGAGINGLLRDARARWAAINWGDDAGSASVEMLTLGLAHVAQ